MLLKIPFMLTLGMASVSAVTAAASDMPHGVWPGFCCFTLAEAGTGTGGSSSNPMQFDDKGGYHGDAVLGVPDRETGWFCINLSAENKVLFGDGDGACIVTGGGDDLRFTCLDPTPGFTQYALVAGSDGRTMLSVDGSFDLKACPNTHGPAGERIYGRDKTGEGCRTVQFVTKDLAGTCQDFKG
ncbi:hypothetical protein JDV02_006704 [Purpureocillium takamizusanense]|uniref:Uncharacterized protein n=1 Tax=Purpureocillium takamizusanense TaxID=2060973 RepID=A0A9Q8QLB8_9HYPO|nr:uncharacterized protein JDV02_006704 [Purpureocillium takamizusanense]UNI20632.1 hypothetical protein JDV02_006704 [Purpureocillium takamizusanense]